MTDTLLLPELNWLIWGLITALIVLGLSIIFGLLDIINIAHGEFLWSVQFWPDSSWVGQATSGSFSLSYHASASFSAH
jgi:branched-subunit amino acid ABC-type transport system permease component